MATFVLAFIVAPRSCEGGLTFYFWSGVVSLIALAALPLSMALGRSIGIRLAWALGFFAFGFAAWFAGLFAANVQIMCRLF